jgi:phosphatidylserine/phosphatidylglycerophosphate/cardiolipin synthase-like enzyme
VQTDCAQYSSLTFPFPIATNDMANRGVRGRVVFAEAGDPPVADVAVAAFDIDPFNADEALGKEVRTSSTGEFAIDYTPESYQVFLDRKPDIEVRVYGPGKRVLWQTKVHEEVDEELFPLPELIRIHRSNFPTNNASDPSWLVCHTSLDPANGTPIRLTTGNELEWLIDGAAMYPAVTNAIEGATTSVRFMNMAFYIKGLISKFEFATGVKPESPAPTDVAKVSRFERILRRKATQNVKSHVLVWELQNIPDLLVKLLDKADTADEVREFFKNTQVVTSSFESTQLLHIKLIVVDGTEAFVIGSTVSQSYFTDTKHLIRDARHGKTTDKKPLDEQKKGLIHDASFRVKGPAVRHVDETFTTIWNIGPIAPVISPSPMPAPLPDGASVQMLRTLPGEVFAKDPPNPNDPAHVPFGETGILEAYQRAIAKAEQYIYIEDQYMVSQDIADALAIRMQEKPDLDVIFVLNVKPDIPGYHRKQAALLNQLRDSLPLNQRQRFGVFTIWSTDDVPSAKFEIAHIYMHAKVAIIDDVWATVGTANLDGASLNRRQWGLILKAEVADRIDSIIDAVKELGAAKALAIALLGPLVISLVLMVFGPLLMLAGAAGATFSLPTLVGFIIGAVLKETARDSQHANPHRERQPPRHPELNVVLYDGIAGQPTTTGRLARQLRKALWEEHLGKTSDDTRPATGWLSEWRAAADAHKTRLQDVSRPQNPVRPGLQTAKVLEWVSDPTPKDYLRTLGVKVENITLRSGGEPLPFVLNEVDAE